MTYLNRKKPCSDACLPRLHDLLLIFLLWLQLSSCKGSVWTQTGVFQPGLSRIRQDNNNIFVLQIISINNHLTGALASEGVVEGAVEEAGVRMVLFGATPCLAHLILCLCPVIGEKLNMTGPQDNCY